MHAVDGDVAYVVLELLSKSKAKLPSRVILEEVPFDKKEVVPVLTAFHSIGLLSREPSEDGMLYELNRDVNAYHITKAVELGLDIGSLSALLPISEKQKKAALTLSSQAEKLKELDATNQAKIGAARGKLAASGPRDVIVDTLERLALASEISIEDFTKGSKDSEDILKALREARDQAHRALKDYQASLKKWGGNDTF